MSLISLRNQKEFDLVKNRGSEHSGRNLILLLATKCDLIKSDKENPVFFGMKVSRRLSKKAVIRNKVRRRIRHLVQNIVKNPKVDTDQAAFIVIPKKGFDKTKFAQLNYDFRRTFSRALRDRNAAEESESGSKASKSESAD